MLEAEAAVEFDGRFVGGGDFETDALDAGVAEALEGAEDKSPAEALPATGAWYGPGGSCLSL